MKKHKVLGGLIAITMSTVMLAGCSPSGDTNEPEPVQTVMVTEEPAAQNNEVKDTVLSSFSNVTSDSSFTQIGNGPGSPEMLYANLILKDGSSFSQEDLSKLLDIAKQKKTETTSNLLVVVTDPSGNVVDLTGYAASVAGKNWEPDNSTGGVAFILEN